MAAKPLGYRSQLRTASDQEIEERNRERAEADLPPLPPLREARDRARTALVELQEQFRENRRAPIQEGSPLHQELEHLHAHPDERVQAEFYHSGARIPYHAMQVIGAQFTGPLQNQHIREARQEGYAWTTLLSRIADAGMFGYGTGKPKNPETQIAKLAPWLETTASREEIRLLLAEKTEGIFETVCRHARHLGKAEFQQILDKGPTYVIDHAAKNPNAWGALEHFGTRVVQRIREGEVPEGKQHSILTTYLKAGGTLLDDVRGTIMRKAVELSTEASKERRDRRVAHKSELKIRNLVDLLLKTGGLPGERYEALHQEIEENEFLAERLIKDARTPTETLRHIAQKLTDTRVRRELAGNERAMADPETRERLLKDSSGKEVYRAIIATSGPEEGKRALERLLGKNPKAALDLITEGNLPEDFRVPRERLARILGSANPTLRNRAFQVLVELPLEDAPEAEEQKRSAPRRKP